MEHLNVNTGAVTLAVNGDESRAITFYPTDARFAEGFYGLTKAFLDKQKEIGKKEKAIQDGEKEKQFELRREMFSFIRGEIDKLFGRGTAQTVFGDHDVQGAYVDFFREIGLCVSKARKAEVDRYLNTDAEESTVMDA